MQVLTPTWTSKLVTTAHILHANYAKGEAAQDFHAALCNCTFYEHQRTDYHLPVVGFTTILLHGHTVHVGWKSSEVLQTVAPRGRHL